MAPTDMEPTLHAPRGSPIHSQVYNMAKDTDTKRSCFIALKRSLGRLRELNPKAFIFNLPLYHRSFALTPE